MSIDAPLTFHNTRWPLLTTLLLNKGWTQAKEGETADLAFVDDGAWRKEKDSRKRGRVKFFSRVYTDIFSNKRSCAIGLQASGCIPFLMPPTFTTLTEWEEAVVHNEEDLWFFKAKNSSNSKGISVAKTVEEGRSILAVHSSGKNTAATTTFDEAFMTQFAANLEKQGHVVPLAALRQSFNSALCSDVTKLQKSMNNYIVQRGVRNPLLIKQGRKFCLRIYVLALVRPKNSAQMRPVPVQGAAAAAAAEAATPLPAATESKQQEEHKGEEDPKITPTVQQEQARELEVYVSKLEIGRPQKSPYDAKSTDPAAQYEDSSTLYASVSDGTCYPIERWEKQFVKIKESVKRVMTSGMTLSNSEQHVKSPQFKAHFAFELLNKDPTLQPENLNEKGMDDEGRLSMMG